MLYIDYEPTFGKENDFNYNNYIYINAIYNMDSKRKRFQGREEGEKRNVPSLRQNKYACKKCKQNVREF